MGILLLQVWAQKEGMPRSSRRAIACRAPAASRAVRCWQLADRQMARPRHSRPQWESFMGTTFMTGQQRRGDQQRFGRDMRQNVRLTDALGTTSVSN